MNPLHTMYPEAVRLELDQRLRQARLARHGRSARHAAGWSRRRSYGASATPSS